MLDHLGEHQAADAVGAAIAEIRVEGEVGTRDMGGANTTDEVGAARADRIRGGAVVHSSRYQVAPEENPSVGRQSRGGICSRRS